MQVLICGAYSMLNKEMKAGMEIMFKRLMFVSILLMSGTVASTAQDDSVPSWCPVDAPIVFDVNSMHGQAEIVDSGVNVYTAGDDGLFYNHFDVTGVEAAKTSFDALYVAMIRSGEDGNREIWLVSQTNHEPRMVVSADDLAELRPENEVEPDGYGVLDWAWVPGTHKLLFNSRIYYNGEGLFSSIADDLIMVDADTGELTPILPMPEGGAFFVSPDGKYAVVENRDSVRLVDLADGLVKTIAVEHYQAVGVGGGVVYSPTAWLPDSSGFLIAVPATANPIMDQNTGVVEVYQVDVETQESELIGTHAAYYMPFRFSPDLTKVAYWLSAGEGSNTRTLFIADIAGTDRIAITTADLLEFGEWLPNSAYFTYILTVQDFDRLTVVSDICGQAGTVD